MEGWKSKVRVAPCLGAGENTAISSWWVAQHHCNLTYAKSRTEATSSYDSYKGIIIRDLGFPGGSDGKSACNMGDPGLIPGVGRSPGEGNGNPLQYSCLENPMDGGAWQAIVHGVTNRWTRVSDFIFIFRRDPPSALCLTLRVCVR